MNKHASVIPFVFSLLSPSHSNSFLSCRGWLVCQKTYVFVEAGSRVQAHCWCSAVGRRSRTGPTGGQTLVAVEHLAQVPKLHKRRIFYHFFTFLTPASGTPRQPSERQLFVGVWLNEMQKGRRISSCLKIKKWLRKDCKNLSGSLSLWRLTPMLDIFSVCDFLFSVPFLPPL